MTRIEYITENIERIKFDVKIGIIPCAIINHLAIYSRYDYYKRIGMDVSCAVACTSEDMEVSESWVYSVKKRMEEVV